MTMTIDEAIIQMAESKALVKRAGELEAEARKVLLDTFDDHPTRWIREEPGSKTFIAKAAVGPVEEGGYAEVSITFPQSAEVPAHFDDGRTVEFREKVLDVLGQDAQSYFTERVEVSYTFRQERWLEDAIDAAKQGEKSRAAQMHGLLSEYIVPGKPRADLTPRVSAAVKQARRSRVKATSKQAEGAGTGVAASREGARR